MNQNATGANTGLTWQDAFTTFRAAAEEASSGDSIFIAAGTYSPAQELADNPRAARRMYRFGFPISVFGHFEGTEEGPEDRDFGNPAYETIFDGEHSSKSIFYFREFPTHGNDPAIFDGVTMIRGNAAADINRPGHLEDRDAGAAIFAQRELHINNCKFLDMIGGSAIFQSDFNAPLNNLTITNCLFKDGAYGVSKTTTNGKLIIENCHFKDLEKGVGFNLGKSASAVIIKNTELIDVDQALDLVFVGDIALFDITISGSKKRGNLNGNTLLIKGGNFTGNVRGVFLISNSIVEIDRAKFMDNWAIEVGAAIRFSNCRARVVNCAFVRNRASAFRFNDGANRFEYIDSHGGVFFVDFSILTLTHNTFALNWAEEGDDISGRSSVITARNNIFWSDYAYSQPPYENSLFVEYYNDIETPFRADVNTEFVFGANLISGSATDGIDFGEQYIDQPPNFTDLANNDFQLDICSYAIDRGNAADLDGLNTDLFGNTRYQGNAPDLGAVETPYIGQSISSIVKQTKAAEPLYFEYEDFADNYQDPAGSLKTLQINRLPEEGKLTLGTAPVTAGQKIPAASIGLLQFKADSCISAASFQWSGSAGNDCSLANVTEVNINITDGGYTRPGIATINQESDALCEGDTLTLSGPEGFTYYRWFGNVTPSGDQALATRNGEVRLQVFDKCWSKVSEAYDVAFKPVPTPIAPDARHCGPGMLTFEASGADAFVWYADAERQQIVNTYPIFTNTYSEPITYFVEGTTDGCTSPLVEVRGLIDQAPTITPLLKDTTLCDNWPRHNLMVLNHQEGENYSLYAVEQNGFVPYPGAVSSRGRINFSPRDYWAPDQHEATLAVVAASGACIGDTTTVGVLLLDAPQLLVPVTPPENLEICQGESVRFTAPPGYSYYEWNIKNEVGETKHTTASNELQVNEAGVVRVVSYMENGCFSLSTFAGEVQVGSPDAPVIQYDGKGIIRVESPVEGSYQWYRDGLLLEGMIMDSLVADVPGNYQVQLTNANNCISGLSNILEVSLDQTAQCQSLEISIRAKPVTCFGTATGLVELAVEGGKPPYEATLIQGSNQFFSGTVGNTTSFEDLVVGDYAVNLTDNIGCTRQQNFEITESQDQSLQVNATIHPTDCFDTATGRVDLTIEGGTLPYHVDLMQHDEPLFSETLTGATSVENLTTGEYVLNVTDNVGCTWQRSLSLSAGQEAPLVCTYRISDQQQGIITLDCNGGSPPYSYAWDNDVAEGPVSASLEDGSYAVTVTDDLGCVTRLENMVLKKDGVVTSLPEDLNALGYQFYPNPCKGELWLTAHHIENVEIRISDVTGQELMVFNQPLQAGKPVKLTLPVNSSGLLLFRITNNTTSKVFHVIRE